MNTKTTTDQFDFFLESYLQELIATPDSEILEDTSEAAERAIGSKILDSARASAAKRRMQAAKAGIADTVVNLNFAKTPFSPAVARAYLAKRYGDDCMTLAARNIGDLSDDDVLRLYAQLLHLEEQSRKAKTDDSPE
jgi:hypothetical protein